MIDATAVGAVAAPAFADADADVVSVDDPQARYDARRKGWQASADVRGRLSVVE